MMKQTNKCVRAPAESVERRVSMERNSTAERVAQTQSCAQSQHGLDRVRAAPKTGTERFTSLFHHITVELLGKAYEALKRKAKPGEDGHDWSLYGGCVSSARPDLCRRAIVYIHTKKILNKHVKQCFTATFN